MDLLYVAAAMFGYLAAGIYSFADLCRTIRCSNNVDDWEVLMGFQYARVGFLIATLLVFTWPLWQLPAMLARFYRSLRSRA
jgi:hypothetical protein